VLYKTIAMIPCWLIVLLSANLVPFHPEPAGAFPLSSHAATKISKFRVLVLYQNGGHHILFSQRGRLWLDKLAADSNLLIEYIQTTENIDENFLDKFQLFIQLDYPPYGWTANAMAAFQHYIEKGTGGWIGFHHASLIGEFDGYPPWAWYRDFLGGITWKDYIPGFADARVIVEDTVNPCMRNIPKSFLIEKEEWYIYDKSPRPNVRIMASVDESSYAAASVKKMGDHPVIWTNTQVAARNVYIFMGHSPDLFDNKVYTTIFRNAIFWAAEKDPK
jgi:uncharacterized protein